MFEMKKYIIGIIEIIIITILFNYNFENQSSEIKLETDIEIGKDIYLIIDEDEIVDYKYLEKIIGQETDNTLELIKDEVLVELRDYMYENNLKFKEGDYVLNQADDFDRVMEILEFETVFEERYDNVIFKGKISEDLPEFIFDFRVKMNGDSDSGCILQTLKISDSSTDSVIQEIDIYDLTMMKGKDNLTVWDKNDIEFVLEDFNFDGYLDFKIFDTMNGTYLEEWIYLIWNPELEIFEENEELSRIPSVYFDQEKKLVYGTDRFWAGGHEYQTYQYIDGELIMTKSVYTNKEAIRGAELEKVCELAQIEIGEESAMIIYEETRELDKKSNEMRVKKAEYVFYKEKSAYSKEDMLGSFDIDSDVAKLITDLKDK